LRRLNNSRAHRAGWLLEELKLEYDVKVFKRNKNMRAPPELKEVHPLGKSPVIGIKVPGADKEIMLAESATIIDYLCEHFGKHLIPSRYPSGKEGVLGAETEDWMRYRVSHICSVRCIAFSHIVSGSSARSACDILISHMS